VPAPEGLLHAGTAQVARQQSGKCDDAPHGSN
jgi:hypothetical protein